MYYVCIVLAEGEKTVPQQYESDPTLEHSDAYCKDIRVLGAQQKNPHRNVYVWSGTCFLFRIASMLVDITIKVCVVVAIVVSETSVSQSDNCMSHIDTFIH